MTTTKQSWLKRSLAVLLAVMMVMSMGVANVFALTTSKASLADGTYKVPFSFNYYMAGTMYEMAAGKPNALIKTPATVEVRDGKMTAFCREGWDRLCNGVPVSLAERRKLYAGNC